MSLNANSPTVVGLEWFPYRQRGLAIGQDRQWAARWTPGAQTGDDLMLYMASTSGSPVIAVEIVPEASVVPGATVTATYRPNADGSVTGVTDAGASSTPPLYTDVDEAVVDITDYNIMQSVNGYGLFEYASTGFTGRPFSVTLHADVEALAGGTAALIPRLSLSSVVYDAPSISVPTGRETITYTWTYNPSTGAPWTAADITGFDSGSYAGLANSSSTTNLVRVYQEWMTVDYTTTDSRVAAGKFSAVDGWNTVSMLSPAAADTWSLAAATSYLVILSNPQGTGSSSWRALDSGSAHPDISSCPVTFDTRAVPSALGTTDTAAPGFIVLDTTATALTGQPYVTITEQTVYTGRVLQQEVTLPDTASRGWLKFVARQQSTATTVSLLAKLKKRSDDSQVGGTVTVTPFDVRSSPRLPQSLSLPGASGAAGSAAQHYVEFTSTAASGVGWLVTTLTTGETATEKLTTNQQGLETDTTGWAAGATTTISQSATYARTGTKSLRLECTAGTATVSATTPTGTSGFTVIVGAAVTVTAYGRVNAAISTKTGRLKIVWYTAAGATISTTTGSDVSLPNSGFVALTVTAPAPATAAYAAVKVEVDSLPNGGSNYVYFDDFAAQHDGVYASLGIGGNTDTATIAGTETVGTDVPVLVGTTRTAPASQGVAQT